MARMCGQGVGISTPPHQARDHRVDTADGESDSAVKFCNVFNSGYRAAGRYTAAVGLMRYIYVRVTGTLNGPIVPDICTAIAV